MTKYSKSTIDKVKLKQAQAYT